MVGAGPLTHAARPLTLTPAQRDAVRHVRAVALRERPTALAAIGRTLAGIGVRHHVAQLVGAVGRAGRLTLNFHPDRLLADGRTVAEALATEGVYRSQFETGISNGGLSAYPGGDRDRWERRLFGGAYQRPGVRPAERPKYGGLNLLDHPDGACPRFGSCHLRLRSEVLTRTTFCFGDSHLGPRHVGTVDVIEPVLAALLAATVDTDTGSLLAATARRHGFPLRWHAGFALPMSQVDAEFRGPAIPPLAARVHAEFARPGEPLHAALIGRAAASVVTDPGRWADRGRAADTLAQLKQLWHVLVRFGTPYGG